MHLELSRERVEYTLISMHQQAISSRIPFVYPTNEEIHQEIEPSIDVVTRIKSSKVCVPDISTQSNDDVIGDAPEQTNVSDDPPPKVMSVKDVPSPDNDDEVLEEIIFEDESTYVVFFLVAPRSKIFRSLLPCKAHLHFGLTSSLEASDENVAPEHNDNVPPPPEVTPKGHQDSHTQEAPHDDGKRKDDADHKLESSTSDTSSSDKNIADPFALLELRDNVATANSRVDKFTHQVTDLE